jgi:hypothetical protein
MARRADMTKTVTEKHAYEMDDIQNATRGLAMRISAFARQHDTPAVTRSRLQEWARRVNEISNQMSSEVEALEGLDAADAIAKGEA